MAGRAGRGTQPGQVILQTYTPEHPVIEAVQQHNYKEFIEIEWGQRQLLRYPPAGRLVLLRLGGSDGTQVQQVAGAIATQVQALLQHIPHEVLGPAPGPHCAGGPTLSLAHSAEVSRGAGDSFFTEPEASIAPVISISPLMWTPLT